MGGWMRGHWPPFLLQRLLRANVILSSRVFRSLRDRGLVIRSNGGLAFKAARANVGRRRHRPIVAASGRCAAVVSAAHGEPFRPVS